MSEDFESTFHTALSLCPVQDEGLELTVSQAHFIAEQVWQAALTQQPERSEPADSWPESWQVKPEGESALVAQQPESKPTGYLCPDDPDPATAFSFKPGVCGVPGCGKVREPVYLSGDEQ